MKQRFLALHGLSSEVTLGRLYFLLCVFAFHIDSDDVFKATKPFRIEATMAPFVAMHNEFWKMRPPLLPGLAQVSGVSLESFPVRAPAEQMH